MTGLGERPRELKWYHAGPMLFGDWGTSRLYVLGLALVFTGRASFWFIAAMCVLLVAVGWSYTIVCRLFPDGGGVYSSARQRSQLLALVGALLLCADYVVTASLSCLDAFHYLGLYNIKIAGLVPLDAALAAGMILVVGGLNSFGPTKTGLAALFIALATIVLTLIIAGFCLPHLGTADFESPFTRSPMEAWIGFTSIVLALSGVEAIANMTGIMVQPVEKTARKSILPVMIEIVVLNLILAAAMSALPDSVIFEKNAEGELVHEGDMLKVIAAQYVGPTFAIVSSLFFAALLFSAVNTALGALVSVLFMLSRDKELPQQFSRLNRFGMPIVPLWVATIVPAVVVLMFPDVQSLAGLYAIGTVGAIVIDLGSTATNGRLSMRVWERAIMVLVVAVLAAIELTIIVTKPDARGFALVVLVAGLAGRVATLASNPAAQLSDTLRKQYQWAAGGCVAAVILFEVALHNTPIGFALSMATAVLIGFVNVRVHPLRAQIIAAMPTETVIEPRKKPMVLPGAYKPQSRIMVATQGNPRLLKFAFEEAKTRQAELLILFIRHLAVTPMGPVEAPKLVEDEVAQALFEQMRETGKAEGVPLKLLYGIAREVPDAILDMAVTHGADLLLLGSTRRGTLWKAMKGDVIQAIAEHLPERVGLLIHA